MIWVTTADEVGLTTITVDGQLAGEFAGPVEACCNQAISKGKPVVLFLRDVSTIDDGGRSLLWRLAAKGIRLKASGVYSAYIVDMIRAEGLTRKYPG